MFDFQQLEVYKKAKAFHLNIQSLLKEQTNLNKISIDQLWRASFSIPLNIAEGSGRFSKPDRKNFFIIARSSLFETIAILDILKDSEKLSDNIYIEFEIRAEELSKILFAMIKNLSQN